ncbi:MAG TPA: glycosyltransferase family 9 protein [Actinomycetota bacterium]|nr:glycosyltransferase family 9 protein [Actinomycetota bacterium]
MPELEPLRRVAILRALRLGDLLCSVPALRALRRAWPHAEITLIGRPWAAWFVRRFSYLLDRFLALPGWPGVTEEFDPGAAPGFLVEAQGRRFDLVVQMHGSGLASNPLALLLGARRTAGYFLPGQPRPDPELAVPYPGHGPEVLRHLELAAALGAPAGGTHLEIPVLPGDHERLTAALGGERLDAYVVLHPGAADPARRWSPEGFAAVGDRLGPDLRVVITGTDDERGVARAVAEAMDAPALDLSGRTDLDALVALVAGARLVVANDTGVSHLADALGVPSVVVFTASDPARWAPLDRELHPVAVGPTIERNPCRHLEGEHRCLRDACRIGQRRLTEIARDAVDPALVVELARRALAQRSSRRRALPDPVG